MRLDRVILLLCLLPGPARAAAPLTLPQAVAYGLEHSPTLNSSQRETLIAEMNRKNSVAAFLPKLDLTANHGLRGANPENNPNKWSSSLSVDLTENLYDNGQSFTNLRTSRLAEEISRIQLLQSRDQLLLDIASQFYNHNLAVRTLEVQREQHSILRKQYEMVESGYRQGLKTRKDYLRFKTQLNRADIDLVNSQDSVTKAEQELKRLMGVPLNSPEQPVFAIDESAPPRDAPAELRVDENREYRIAQLQNESQRLQEEQTRRRLWPELYLSGGANYGSSSYLNSGRSVRDNDSTSWNAVLSLRYNFLDWGTRRREAAIAGERTAITENANTSRLLSLRQELERLRLDIRQLRENFRLGTELLELEKGNLALIDSEYRQGKVSYLDYITSVKDFASARIGYYSSLYGLKRGLLTQHFHRGTLYETIGK